jgi:hypothetical protein
MASREKAITLNSTADFVPGRTALDWFGSSKAIVQSIRMLMSALVQSIAALKNMTPHMSAFEMTAQRIITKYVIALKATRP